MMMASRVNRALYIQSNPKFRPIHSNPQISENRRRETEIGTRSNSPPLFINWTPFEVVESKGPRCAVGDVCVAGTVSSEINPCSQIGGPAVVVLLSIQAFVSSLSASVLFPIQLRLSLIVLACGEIWEICKKKVKMTPDQRNSTGKRKSFQDFTTIPTSMARGMTREMTAGLALPPMGFNAGENSNPFPNQGPDLLRQLNAVKARCEAHVAATELWSWSTLTTEARRCHNICSTYGAAFQNGPGNNPVYWQNRIEHLARLEERAFDRALWFQAGVDNNPLPFPVQQPQPRGEEQPSKPLVNMFLKAFETSNGEFTPEFWNESTIFVRNYVLEALNEASWVVERKRAKKTRE